MAAAIPTALLGSIENSGHMTMLEQPQAATTAIREFLQSLGK